MPGLFVGNCHGLPSVIVTAFCRELPRLSVANCQSFPSGIATDFCRELPRPSSRGPRSPTTSRRRLAADKIPASVRKDHKDAAASFFPFCVLRGLRFATFAFPAYRIHAISHSTLHVDSNAKDAKTFAKVSKTLPRDSFPFASSAGFASRPSLRDLCVFLLIESTLFLKALFTLIRTQRTQRHFAKTTKTLPRVSFPFASSAGFTLRPLRFLPIEDALPCLFTFRIGFNAKDAKVIAKFAKTLTRTFYPRAIVLAP
ncbi:MAG: hypothetical protein DYH05_00920 [Acidobacteria bacterium ACB1]|nr:hypothetical protein [Acidobacteria bacterium ACB1]